MSFIPSLFMALPSEPCFRVYDFLLGPYPNNRWTIINYNLRWPHLKMKNLIYPAIEKDRGDICYCPRAYQPGPRSCTRYRCYGLKLTYPPAKPSSFQTDRKGP